MRMIDNAAGSGTAILISELPRTIKPGPEAKSVGQAAGGSQAEDSGTAQTERSFLRLSIPLEAQP
jgi:hypothetical protein